ncbi:MAG: S-layer homology domain-containing protein [Anaerovoracaceae bacterium]
MRKVLSFVLVLALVLGSFSFAFGLTDIDNSPNKVAIEVNNDLGIITGYTDGTFQGEKAVNRAEFAAMITRALGIPESALAGYSQTSFKDVSGYGWAVKYLAFCESKGIMLGDGKGNVMPGRTISVNEAVTMALRAVGYVDNSAVLVGAWPSNYVTLGKQVGLYADLAEAVTIDRENAAQVIYNALTVGLVAVNADGTTTALNKTLMTAYLGATEMPKAILGDGNYGVDNSVMNVYKNIGAYGTAYENSDNELIAFKIDSTALTGKVDGEKFVVGDTKYELKNITGNAVVFENAATSTGSLDFTTGTVADKANLITGVAVASSDDGETVTLHADVSGKYIYEVYSVVAWKADFAELADSDVQEDIDDGVLLGQDFALDSKDNIKDNGFVLKGVASLADIDEDNVVAVYLQGTEIRMVTVGTKTVEGTVTEVGDGFAYVDKTKYSESDLLAGVTYAPAIDDEGTFFLDYEGNIFDADVEGTTDTFGVLLDVKLGGTWSADRMAQVFTEDEETETFGVVKKVFDVISKGGVATPALMSYALNDKSELKAVEEGIFGVSFTAVTNKVAVASKGGVATTYAVASDVKVFSFDGTDYELVAMADVAKGVDLTAAAVNTQYILDGGKIVALLVDADALDAGTGDDFYGVVNQVTEMKDSVLKLVGFVDGKAIDLTTVKDFGKTVTNVNTDRVAALFIFSPDASGKVDTYTTVAALVSVGVTATNLVTAVSKDGTVITLTAEKFEASEDAVVYKYNTATKKYTVAKLSDIKKDAEIIAAYDTDFGTADADSIADVIIFK